MHSKRAKTTRFGSSNDGSLPELPPYVDTVLGPVPVILVERFEGAKKNERLFGRYVPIQRIIEINAAAPRNVQWQTLWHEWIHVVFWDAGLHNAFSQEQQECVADVIGTARVAELLAALRL